MTERDIPPCAECTRLREALGSIVACIEKHANSPAAALWGVHAILMRTRAVSAKTTTVSERTDAQPSADATCLHNSLAFETAYAMPSTGAVSLPMPPFERTRCKDCGAIKLATGEWRQPPNAPTPPTPER